MGAYQRVGWGQLLATYSADPDPTRNVPGVLNFYVDDPLGTQTGVPTDRSWSVGWSGRVMTDYAGNVMESCPKVTLRRDPLYLSQSNEARLS